MAGDYGDYSPKCLKGLRLLTSDISVTTGETVGIFFFGEVTSFCTHPVFSCYPHDIRLVSLSSVLSYVMLAMPFLPSFNTG